MKIFNTLSRRKEEFVPLTPGEVKMYVCGPTVYNLIHIGNARPMIVFDTVRRYFEYKGYDVKYVSNFTDVDDKIIKKAIEEGVDAIFYPCMTYNVDEGLGDNHYNCPVVAYYPELLMANCEKLNHNNFLYPFLDLNRRSHVVKTLSTMFSRYATKKQVETALEHGFAALEQYRKDIVAEGEEIVRQARDAGKQIIVLAGRPYHIDPEINHGIHKLIGSLGLAVITEDSVAHLAQTPELQALNQWTYHSRMYRAAKYVTTQPDMQLVQLVSFGCGIDAITTDEVRRILETGGKLYTQLKIDEISNLGAIKIRLRSLIAAMEQTQNQTAPETV